MKSIYLGKSFKEGNRISFNVGNKKVSRVAKKIGSLEYFSYNNTFYYLVPSSDWNYGPTAVPMDLEMKNYFNECKSFKGWYDFESLVDNLISEYSNFQRENSSSPAGPNTSSFRAIHRGDIEKCKGETYGRNSYSSGSYFHIGIKIGTNFPKSNEVFNKMFILSSVFSNGSCKYNNSKYPASKSVVYGSAFTAIGIG